MSRNAGGPDNTAGIIEDAIVSGDGASVGPRIGDSERTPFLCRFPRYARRSLLIKPRFEAQKTKPYRSGASAYITHSARVPQANQCVKCRLKNQI